MWREIGSRASLGIFLWTMLLALAGQTGACTGHQACGSLPAWEPRGSDLQAVLDHTTVSSAASTWGFLFTGPQLLDSWGSRPLEVPDLWKTIH